LTCAGHDLHDLVHKVVHDRERESSHHEPPDLAIGDRAVALPSMRALEDECDCSLDLIELLVVPLTGGREFFGRPGDETGTRGRSRSPTFKPIAWLASQAAHRSRTVLGRHLTVLDLEHATCDLIAPFCTDADGLSSSSSRLRSSVRAASARSRAGNSSRASTS
jgi:hypothetical protein